MNSFIIFFIKRTIKNKGKTGFPYEFALMIIGIVISVSVVSTAINLFEGYERTLKKVLLDSSSHLLIYPQRSETLAESDIKAIRKKFMNQKEIKSINPVYINSCMLRIGSRVRGCVVRAYAPDITSSDIWIKEYIKKGEPTLLSGGVILGQRLAADLGVSLSDSVSLLFPNVNNQSALGVFTKQKKYKLSGIIETGYYELDRSLILMNSEDAFGFFGTSNRFSFMEIHLKEQYISKTAKLTSKYSSILEHNYFIQNWIDLNGNLFSLIVVEKWLIFLIFSFLIIIAAINAISSVSTVILERKKEIAILMTIGTTNSDIRKIVYYRTLVICLISIIAGIMLGTVFSWLITKQSIYNLKGDVYFIDKITMHISYLNYLMVFLVSMIIIGYCIKLPLKYLDKIQVVDILRGY